MSEELSEPGAAARRRGRIPVGVSYAFLAVVLAVSAAYFFLPTGTESTVTNVVAVTATAGMFAGIVWNRPEPRFAWLLVAVGVLLLAAGDIAYGTGQPVPSVADMFYVSAYPLMGLGLLAVARSRVARRPGSPFVDVAVIAGGMAAVTLLLLAVPAGQEHDVGTAAKLVSIGYPLMDVALLWVLIRPLRSVRTRGPSCLLMVAAILHLLVADTGFVLQNFGTAYSVGGALDAAWLVSYGCFAAALLHPSVARGAMLLPGNGWSSVPTSWTSLRAPAESSIFGAAADAAAVAEAAADAAALARLPAGVSAGQGVRFRLVMIWSGGLLLAFGCLAFSLSVSWQAPDVAMMAGAFAITGSFTLLAGSVRS